MHTWQQVMDAVLLTEGACAATAGAREMASLFQHVIGNPFRPSRTAGPWSPMVVDLAGVLYPGENCAFAMHDALLDAGQVDLADFREPTHPKGCWALDLILGKK